MLRLSSEAKVGIFVFVALVILVYMSLRVGGVKFGREEGYTLIVRMTDAGGLDKNASVKIAGVEVGRVKDITLEDHKAKLRLLIKPQVKIGKDFTAVLKTKGLLGERYIELLPGSPTAPILKDGEEITRVLTYTDVDTLVTMLGDVAGDVKEVTETLKKVFGGKEGEQTLKNITVNIESITRRLDTIISENENRVGVMMASLEEFSLSMREVSDTLNSILTEHRGDIESVIENVKSAAARLDMVMKSLDELAPEVKQTVSSIGNVSRKIEEGEGTLGKLVNDPRLYEDIDKTVKGINKYLTKIDSFRIYPGYRGEFLFDASETKSYFSLRIQPRRDKYYLVEVVDDPRGSVSTETRQTVQNNTTTTVEETTTTDDIKFSVQIAKRFGPLALRGGIIESTGGVGIDYYLMKDRLRLTFEAFDLDRDEGIHLKAGAWYHLNKYLFLVAGMDDFVNERGFASAYMGLGFEFDDEDLKYIFSSAPPISF